MKVRELHDPMDHISVRATEETAAKLIDPGAVLFGSRDDSDPYFSICHIASERSHQSGREGSHSYFHFNAGIPLLAYGGI